jgi:hypothetical protein
MRIYAAALKKADLSSDDSDESSTATPRRAPLPRLALEIVTGHELAARPSMSLTKPSFTAMRRPSRRSLPKKEAPVVKLLKIVRPRKSTQEPFHLQVGWSDRATPSYISLGDVVLEEGRLPPLLGQWAASIIQVASEPEKSQMESWWQAAVEANKPASRPRHEGGGQGNHSNSQ